MAKANLLIPGSTGAEMNIQPQMPDRSAENMAILATPRKKKKRKGYTMMAKGGQVKTTCRGMGSATSGGRFRKDG